MIKVNDFLSLFDGALCDVYDKNEHLVYSDFLDNQHFEEIKNEEIHLVGQDTDRFIIHLKNYESFGYHEREIWYATFPPAKGNELGGQRLVHIETIYPKKGLVEIVPVMKDKTFEGRYIPYYSDINYRMIMSVERLTEKVDR